MALAGGGGFEPPLTGPEPVVLPLNDPPTTYQFVEIPQESQAKIEISRRHTQTSTDIQYDCLKSSPSEGSILASGYAHNWSEIIAEIASNRM